jgi:hypothetical protein
LTHELFCVSQDKDDDVKKQKKEENGDDDEVDDEEDVEGEDEDEEEEIPEGEGNESFTLPWVNNYFLKQYAVF